MVISQVITFAYSDSDAISDIKILSLNHRELTKRLIEIKNTEIVRDLQVENIIHHHSYRKNGLSNLFYHIEYIYNIMLGKISIICSLIFYPEIKNYLITNNLKVTLEIKDIPEREYVLIHQTEQKIDYGYNDLDDNLSMISGSLGFVTHFKKFYVMT